MSEIRNLMLDPWPDSVGTWSPSNRLDVALSMDDGALTITSLRDASNYYAIGLRDGLPQGGGDYVWSFRLLEAPHAAGDRLCTIRQRGNPVQDLLHVSFMGLGVYAIPFHLATWAMSPILYLPASGGTLRADHFLLMTKEDWTHMRSTDTDDGPVRWFAPPKTAATGVVSTAVLDCGEVINAT